MALGKSLSLMALTTAIRLVAGLVTFSVVARYLGREAFGILMLWFSVATLVSSTTNFGMIPYVLREIGANPNVTEKIINECLTIKLVLTGVVFTCAGLVMGVVDMNHPWVFLPLLAATVTDSFIEFLNAGLRARGRFDVETRITTLVALSHALIVIGLAVLYSSAVVVAIGYFLSRVVALIITIPAVAHYFSLPKPARLARSLPRLKAVGTYAADFGLQSLFGNIDSLVINYYVGASAVGVYQAGMRVFQGGAVAAQILSSVFLPRVAALSGDVDGFRRESHRAQMAFLFVGAGFGISITVLAHEIVFVLYGDAYAELIRMFPLFGLLFFARFSAAAWGVVLTAMGEQAFRTMATVLHWCMVILIAPILVSAFGVSGWLLALVAGNVVLALLYARRAAIGTSNPWRTVALTGLAAIAFLPFLHLSP